ncbi:MAG: hypothetical protein HQL58_12660 [Magnetococcales bacterium]|nr:hypothetical protein [Magnetococcales bacterium]
MTDVFQAKLLRQLNEITAESERLSETFRLTANRLASDDWYERYLSAAGFAAIIDKIYTRIEILLMAVAKKIDTEVPDGHSWHRELLQQMNLVTHARPALVSDELFLQLDELRAFRHFERNSYSSTIKPEVIPDKVRLCLAAVALLQRDFDRFLTSYFS